MSNGVSRAFGVLVTALILMAIGFVGVVGKSSALAAIALGIAIALVLGVVAVSILRARDG